jgi:transposase
MRILVAIEAVDGRKGIDSLAQLCQEKLQADPFSGCLFVFRSRRGTSIRILVYDGQGFWLAQKRLSKGRFVWWPSGNQPTRVLEAHQAQLLLAAGNPDAIAAPVWRRVERVVILPCVFHLRSILHSATLQVCQLRADIVVERFARKISSSSDSTLRNIPESVAGGSRRSYVRLGSGSRPTGRCATWCAAVFF